MNKAPQPPEINSGQAPKGEKKGVESGKWEVESGATEVE